MSIREFGRALLMAARRSATVYACAPASDESQGAGIVIVSAIVPSTERIVFDRIWKTQSACLYGSHHSRHEFLRRSGFTVHGTSDYFTTQSRCCSCGNF